MKLSLSLLLTVIAGGLYALCYPSFIGPGWLPLLFIALPFFLWRIEESSSLKQMLLHVLAYNLGLNLVGYYWIPQTLREFGQLPFVVSILLGGLFSAILQPHWWPYTLWMKFRPHWKWKSETGVLVSAFIITILERYIPQQFPSFAGSPWLHVSPYLGLAPVFGVVAFSFISYWVALETYAQLSLKSFRPQVWIVFTAFIVLNGVFKLSEAPGKDQLSVRIVQANVGNFLKVQSEKGDKNSYEEIEERYYNLSTVSNGFKPDLIVWPETAYPNTFFGKRSSIDNIFKGISTLTGAEILIGGYDHDLTKSPTDVIETVYNSSVLINDGKVKESYHKNILIPFGETLPFGPLNEQIVSFVPAVSLFAQGRGTPLMETEDGFRFVTPICYEILSSNYVRSLLNEWGDNRFIVNHTNDSWYGDTAEPHQHLFLSKWRALEFQLPIIRSTNTGITSVIYPDGSESRRLGVGEQGTLDVEMALGTGEATFYQKFGVYPLLVFFFLLFAETSFRERKAKFYEES